MIRATKHGSVGFGSLPMPAPEKRECTDLELKQRWLAALEARCGSRESVRHRVNAELRRADDDQDGQLTQAQFLQLVVTTGNILSEAEATRLFALLAVSPDAPTLEIGPANATLLRAAEHTDADVVPARTSPTQRHSPDGGEKMIKSSQAGGIFMGGAHATDSKDEYTKERHESPESRRKNTNVNPLITSDKNASGIDGGIFGKGSPPSPGGKATSPGGRRSNDSSVPGGIFPGRDGLFASDSADNVNSSR
jgi:hypothetical protein